MKPIILSIFTAVYAFACTVSFMRTCHMFQLNSYNTSEHLKWQKRNMGTAVTNILSLVLALVCFAGDAVMKFGTTEAVILHAITLAALLLFALSELPKKGAKTPLVYTARVKRMAVTYALLCAAAGAAAWLLGGVGADYAVMLLAYALSPALLLLANVINAPIEAAVRRWYLNDALKILRSCQNLTVIGITGSYGKTSVKYFLNEILKQRFNVLMTPGNYNTPMGVVKTVRSSLRGYHEIFICEMGARRVGEIKELCDIASPKYGIVTSVGPQHLETFKSIDNIIKTKLELANNLQPGGAAFINADNEYLRDNMPVGAVTYGTREDAAYSAVLKSVSSSGTQFSIRYPDGSVHDFATQLVGAHNVTNLCGAIAMAHYLDVDDKAIYDGVCRISPVPHRLQLIKKPGMIILDDAYNSNPSGCRAALDTLSRFDGMKILVTPGMVELGSEEERLNREFGSEAAAVCDLVIPVGRRQAVPIVAGLHDAGYPDEKIFVADTIKDAMDKVYSIRCEGAKIVLLENDLPDNY